jgi:hypothetical protein
MPITTRKHPKTYEEALEALAMANQRIADLEDPKTFTGALRLLERGVLDRQLGDELIELTEKVRNQQKAGAISLKLNLKPDDETVKVGADFTVKAPKLPRKESLLFVDGDGTLTRHQPGQLTDPAIGGEVG